MSDPLPYFAALARQTRWSIDEWRSAHALLAGMREEFRGEVWSCAVRLHGWVRPTRAVDAVGNLLGVADANLVGLRAFWDDAP